MWDTVSQFEDKLDVVYHVLSDTLVIRTMEGESNNYL